MSITFQKAPDNHDNLKTDVLHNICDFFVNNPDYLDEFDRLLGKKDIEGISNYISYFRKTYDSSMASEEFLINVEKLCELNDEIIPKALSALLELLLEKLVRRQLKPYKFLAETECYVLFNGNRIGIGRAGKGNIDLCTYLIDRCLGFFYECKTNILYFTQYLDKKGKEWMDSFNDIPNNVGDNKIVVKLATWTSGQGYTSTEISGTLEKQWPNVKIFFYEDFERLLYEGSEEGNPALL